MIWLDAPVEVLYQRVSRDASRPLLQRPDPRQTLTDILAERRSLYSQADLRFTVTGNDAARDVAQQLVTALDSIVKPSATPEA